MNRSIIDKFVLLVVISISAAIIAGCAGTTFTAPSDDSGLQAIPVETLKSAI